MGRQPEKRNRGRITFVSQYVLEDSCNFGKRLVKRPKLFFLDSGLACRLLHIADINQLRSHPLWGALVETWCVGEVLKGRCHRGKPSALWFWRSGDGHEVDLVIEQGARLVPIEIKANRSPRPDLLQGLRKFQRIAGMEKVAPGFLIYGGDEQMGMGRDRWVSWSAIDDALGELA